MLTMATLNFILAGVNFVVGMKGWTRWPRFAIFVAGLNLFTGFLCRYMGV